MVGHGFCRTTPHIPVQTGRYRLTREITFPGARIVGRYDRVNFADTSIAYQFAPQPIRRHRALLTAGLEDALVLPNGFHDFSPLVNRECHRLFGVDVFPGLARVDAHDRPPVIGRGRDDRIDIFPLQQFAVVLVSGSLVGLGCFFGTREVHIRDSHDAPEIGEFIKQLESPATDTDATNANPFIRRRDALSTQYMPWNIQRGRRGDRGDQRKSQKRATAKSCGWHNGYPPNSRTISRDREIAGIQACRACVQRGR